MTTPPVYPCLFLDRDGVIIEDVPYLKDPAGVRLFEGIIPIISWARSRCWRVVVATNQSGIARGYFNEEDYKKVNQKISQLLSDRGSFIDAWYHCPYHGNNHPLWAAEKDSRKPAPGMFLKAEREMNLDLNRSIMLGDKKSDVINFNGLYPNFKTYLIKGKYSLDNISQEIIFANHLCLLDFLQKIDRFL
ncbi:MAG: HAD-IIIA family hydrolase [Oligoflexia bacterium]|nr:HAD-IIIA family hydrolase [Oligoflexia bacterium]